MPHAPRAFAGLIERGHSAFDELLLSLASDVAEAYGDDGGASQVVAYQRLSQLSASLDGACTLAPREQLELVDSAIISQFKVTSRLARRSDLSDLRPDVVLERREGHPVVVAALAVAAAQRMGLPLATVASQEHVLIAHRAVTPPLVMEVARRSRVLDDVRALADMGLSWRCSHEVSGMILDLIADQAESAGLRPVLVRAKELATALPLETDARTRRVIELHRARSAWN